MAADLISRLLLDTKQFDDNIKRTRNQLNNFERTVGKVGKAIGKAFIVIEGAKAILDTFKFGIDSSSEASKIFDTSIDAAKTTVSNFFSSLISGDWKPFQNGLKESIDLAKDFADAMHDQEKVNEFGGGYADFLEGKRNQLEHLIGDENSSMEERKKAYDEYIRLGNEEIKQRQRILDITKEVIDTGLASKGYGEYYKDFNAEELVREMAYVNDSQNKLNDAQKAFRDLINSSNIKPYVDTLAQQTDKIGTVLRDMNSALKDLNGDTSATVEIEPVVPQGSLQAIEDQISDTQAQLLLAIDQQSRTKLYNEIQELEEKKRIIEFQYKFPNAPTGEIKAPSLSSMVKVDMPTKLPKIENPIKKDDIDLNNQYVESLNAIANVMGSVSNMTSEGAAAWLSWAANVMTAVAQAIPAITTLIAAKTAEGAASAGAEAAKTPFVGWLLVGGAIATALAAFASIPSFNDGGIFQSYLTTGDKNLARLNGGEMILNKGQQANLFNLLDYGVTPMRNANVKFEIEGKKLVGVINNYNNKRSKVM